VAMTSRRVCVVGVAANSVCRSLGFVIAHPRADLMGAILAMRARS
jgi:hypothetical protein